MNIVVLPGLTVYLWWQKRDLKFTYGSSFALFPDRFLHFYLWLSATTNKKHSGNKTTSSYESVTNLHHQGLCKTKFTLVSKQCLILVGKKGMLYFTLCQ